MWAGAEQPGVRVSAADAMAPKRKEGNAAPAPAAKKVKKKHAGGRPTAAATLSKDAPAAGAAAGPMSVSAMFGARAPTTPAAFVSDMKKWDFEGIGGEEKVPQKQVRMVR